jgi:hypothetical protein
VCVCGGPVAVRPAWELMNSDVAGRPGGGGVAPCVVCTGVVRAYGNHRKCRDSHGSRRVRLHVGLWNNLGCHQGGGEVPRPHAPAGRPVTAAGRRCAALSLPRAGGRWPHDRRDRHLAQFIGRERRRGLYGLPNGGRQAAKRA